jgi:hypothetical protein
MAARCTYDFFGGAGARLSMPCDPIANGGSLNANLIGQPLMSFLIFFQVFAYCHSLGVWLYFIDKSSK